MTKVVETEALPSYGLVGHAARLRQQKKRYHKVLSSDHEVRAFEEVVVNGILVKKSVVRTVHPQDNFSGFKASDFALENVIAVGALDSLKEGQFHANTTSELADHMEGSMDNLINAVDAAQASSDAAAQPNQDGEQ